MTERDAFKVGGIFQGMMMATYLVLLHLYKWSAGAWSLWLWPSHAGAILFFYCLVVLYVLKRRTTKLITNGPFKYTRHPMYSGLFLMNLTFWLPHPTSDGMLFYMLQAQFVACLIGAAWFQEKETLARFGKEAEAYYARTPRLAFLYPFI